MERITHENARYSYGGGQQTSAVTAEASLEMSAVVGRPHALELWVNSPLNMDATGLDIIWRLRERKPNVRISNMPVQGMSGPITLPGMLALTAAECFGAATVLRTIGVSSCVTYRTDAFWGYTVDMRSTNVLLSGPDYLRLMVFCVYLAKRHGIRRPMGKALLTSSKLPDIQAASEKAAQAAVSSMAGVGTFVGAGSLAGVEIHSPIQMVVDHEILSWVDALVKPQDLSASEFFLDVIDRVGPGGTFMDQESTVASFRATFWESQLFSINPYQSWIAEQKPEALEKARDILNSLKVAQEPLVSADQQRQLRRIEETFAARL